MRPTRRLRPNRTADDSIGSPRTLLRSLLRRSLRSQTGCLRRRDDLAVVRAARVSRRLVGLRRQAPGRKAATIVGVIAFKPDPTKVPNPFAYKDDSAEALHTLGEYLSTLTRFFESEITREQDLYDGWTRYFETNGGPATVAVAFSVSHVLGMREELKTIAVCDRRHDVGWFGKILILMHIGLIELVEGGTHVDFAAWASGQMEDQWADVQKKSSRDLRKYMAGLKEEYDSKYGAARRLSDALTKGLHPGEQARLMMGYVFSGIYRLGEKGEDPWLRQHLHCRSRRKVWEKDHSGKDYPYAGVCGTTCPTPTAEEIALCMPRLAKRHLYVMRNQLVHRASPTIMAYDDQSYSPENSVPPDGNLSDVFFADDEHLVDYEVRLGTTEVTGILRRCIWNRFAGMTPSPAEPLPDSAADS